MNLHLEIKIEPILTCVLVINAVKNYYIMDYLSFITYFVVLFTYRSSFDIYEMVLCTISLVQIEKRIPFKQLFHITHLMYFANLKETLYLLINLLIYTNFSQNFIKNFTNLIIQEQNNILRWFICVTVCLFLEFICLLNNYSINIKRKLFHFMIFLIYYNKSNLAVILGQMIIFCLILLTRIKYINLLTKQFRSRRDYGKITVSHIILLTSVCYSSLFLNNINYNASLIVICILDSLASIFGKCIFNSKKKSLISTLFSVFFTFIVSNLILKNGFFIFYLFMGIIEFLLESNDNLFLPFFCVVLLK